MIRGKEKHKCYYRNYARCCISHVSCFLVAVNARPFPHGLYFPYYTPDQAAFPGGRAVNYLSHETEAFGDDLSSLITEQSRSVTALGDDIQHATNHQSQVVDDIGHEVDSDDTPFPVSQVEEYSPEEEEQEDYWG